MWEGQLGSTQVQVERACIAFLFCTLCAHPLRVTTGKRLYVRKCFATAWCVALRTFVSLCFRQWVYIGVRTGVVYFYGTFSNLNHNCDYDEPDNVKRCQSFFWYLDNYKPNDCKVGHRIACDVVSLAGPSRSFEKKGAFVIFQPFSRDSLLS